LPKSARWRCRKGAHVVPSLVGNGDHRLVVDADFRAVLETEGATFESLPVAIEDDSRRVLAKHHVLIHPLVVYACGTDFDPFTGDATVVAPRRAGKAPPLFFSGKPDHMHYGVFVNEALARALYARQLGNVILLELPLA
jgi:hypothetical protein